MFYRYMYKCDVPSFKAYLIDSHRFIEFSKPWSYFQKCLRWKDGHALEKELVLRANSKPYVTKAKKNADLKSLNLVKKYPTKKIKRHLKTKTFVKGFYKKERRKYYRTLNLRKITDNSLNTVEPLLSNREIPSQKYR